MRRWGLPLVALTVIGLAAAGALAWFVDHPLAARLSTRWIAPDAPAPDSPDQTSQERSAIRALARDVRGTLVWSSNRGGNHELYAADLATGRLTRLTDHPHVDYFSRFSPDGRRISFLRSRRPWVSFRESESWDLMLMDADGTNARRIAEHAYHPLWTPDGRGLTFVRDNRITLIDVETGQEKVLFHGADPPTSGDVRQPMLGADGRLVFQLGGVSRARRGVGILSLSSRTFTRVSPNASACEISWIGTTGRVVWVEASGRGGTRIMHTPEPGSDPEELIDLPGAYSHEYFPQITPDGRWLVWGAAAEGHEHDRADYEIFVWRIGTPAESARRITYSSSNDQWPDLRLE
jgi:Tol biopolymer transport system component